MTAPVLRALLIRLGAAAEVVEASAERFRQRSCIVPDDALDDLANATSAARDALGLHSLLLADEAAKGGAK